MKDIIILDGGASSQLTRHTKETADGHPLWTSRFLIANPDAIMNMHLDYLNAGSQIITTVTYQANISLLKKHLKVSDEEANNIIKKAVSCARTAKDIFTKNNPNSSNVLIAGSIGPYGASLLDGSEYTGNYENSTSVETMEEYHRPQLKALFEAGVDIFAFETVPCKTEAEVLVRLLKEYPTMKAWLSFNCRTDGHSIASGDSFQEIAAHCFDLNPEQLLAIGTNCIAPHVVEKLFDGINTDRANNPIPLIVYPNSGEIYEKDEWKGKDQCIPIQAYIPKWLDLGVKYVGSCCRTYSEDISSIKDTVLRHQQT